MPRIPSGIHTSSKHYTPHYQIHQWNLFTPDIIFGPHDIRQRVLTQYQTVHQPTDGP